MRIIEFIKRVIRKIKEDDLLTFSCRIFYYSIVYFLLFKNSVEIFILRLFAKKQLVIKGILGGKMYLNIKDDPGISCDLYKTNIREMYIAQAIEKEIRPNDIIIDIGANIGFYALLEARIVGANGKVYAIEPVARNMELLRKNIVLNNFSNIQTFQMAMGSKNEMSQIFVSKKYNWSSMLRSEAIDSTIINQTAVQVMTLDEFLKDKPMPALIRMDVEGYEAEIINGMKEILQSNQPLKIFMELHPAILQNKSKELLINLKNYGFEAKIVTNEPPPYILRQKKCLQKMLSFLSGKIAFKFGYLNLNLNDLINHPLIEQGKWGCLEILFIRK